MKHFSRLILGIILVLGLQNNALAASSSKIAVVDIQKLQEQSKTFQKAKGQLREKFETMQKKLDDEKNALLKLEEDFRKQSMMLSLDAKEDKKRELESKKRYYKYLYEDFTQEMKEAELEVTRRVVVQLEKVVEKIAAREGYTLILERRTVGLIYRDPAIDIADQVTEAYDKMQQ